MLSCLYSQEEGHIALIEQNELYTPNSDPNQDLLNPHKDRTFLEKLRRASPSCRQGDSGGSGGSDPILRSLKNHNLSGSLIDSILHGREMGMSELPGDVKRVLHPNQADDFKVKLKESLKDGTWGKTNLHFDGFEKLVGSPPDHNSYSCASSPNPQVGGAMGVASPTPTNISSLSSTVTSDLSGYSTAANFAHPPPQHSHAPPPHNYAPPPHSYAMPSSCDQPIHYYPPGGAPSPVSAQHSPQPPPTFDAVNSPPHSSMMSGVSSPTPSLVSSAYSGQIVNNHGPHLMPVIQGHAFSSANAISATFGNASTTSIPNFTGDQYRYHHHQQQQCRLNSVPDPELSGILNQFEQPPSHGHGHAYGHAHINRESEEYGEEFLKELVEDAEVRVVGMPSHAHSNASETDFLAQAQLINSNS